MIKIKTKILTNNMTTEQERKICPSVDYFEHEYDYGRKEKC